MRWGLEGRISLSPIHPLLLGKTRRVPNVPFSPRMCQNKQDDGWNPPGVNDLRQQKTSRGEVSSDADRLIGSRNDLEDGGGDQAVVEDSLVQREISCDRDVLPRGGSFLGQEGMTEEASGGRELLPGEVSSGTESTREDSAGTLGTPGGPPNDDECAAMHGEEEQRHVRGMRREAEDPEASQSDDEKTPSTNQPQKQGIQIQETSWVGIPLLLPMRPTTFPNRGGTWCPVCMVPIGGKRTAPDVIQRAWEMHIAGKKHDKEVLRAKKWKPKRKTNKLIRKRAKEAELEAERARRERIVRGEVVEEED